MSVKTFHFAKKKPLTEKEKLEAKKKLEEQREKDSEIVEGIFRSHGIKGKVKFSYHAYKEDGTDIYEMEDGVTYKIPRGVANHINERACYNEREHVKGPDGQLTLATIIKKKEKRYEFIPTGFNNIG